MGGKPLRGQGTLGEKLACGKKKNPHLNIKDVHTKTPIKDLMFYYYVFLRFWQDGILGFSQKASKKAT